MALAWFPAKNPLKHIVECVCVFPCTCPKPFGPACPTPTPHAEFLTFQQGRNYSTRGTLASLLLAYGDQMIGTTGAGTTGVSRAGERARPAGVRPVGLRVAKKCGECGASSTASPSLIVIVPQLGQGGELFPSRRSTTVGRRIAEDRVPLAFLSRTSAAAARLECQPARRRCKSDRNIPTASRFTSAWRRKRKLPTTP